jgi:two-component system chemotaxis response regulator CheY
MAKNILVIDDSASIRALMRLVLEQAGHRVFEASDGEDAYELLDGRTLDLILCDLAMPRMDGMSFLRLLRHHPRYRHTPLALVTTETRPERRAEARSAGAQAYLAKPVRPALLLEAVQRLCPTVHPTVHPTAHSTA